MPSYFFKLTKSNSNINSFIILPTSTLQAQINYLQSGMKTKEGEAISLAIIHNGNGNKLKIVNFKRAFLIADS